MTILSPGGIIGIVDGFSNKFRFRFNNDFFLEPIETDNFVIYQIGDLFCDYDTVIGDHTQDMQMELSFVDNGSGVISANGTPTKVAKGDIYLTLDGDVHRIASGNVDTLRFFYIAFNIKAASPLFPAYDCFRARYSDPAARVFRFPYIFPQMTNILSEITYRNEFYLQLIDDNLSQIVVSLYRNAAGQLTSFNKYQIDSRKGMIYNIAHYISNNLRSIVSLSELAETFSYDYSYMSKRFKQVMGQSMQSFFQQKKLEYASELLSQEHKSVTEVAEILNYSSIHNFSRAFKNFYGVSPQRFPETLKTGKIDPPPWNRRSFPRYARKPPRLSAGGCCFGTKADRHEIARACREFCLIGVRPRAVFTKCVIFESCRRPTLGFPFLASGEISEAVVTFLLRFLRAGCTPLVQMT